MEIPASFEYKGKHYNGIISKVAGAGSSAHFHVMVSKYYMGQLFYTDQWVYDGPYIGMGEFFGYAIIAFVDANYIEI